MTVSDPAPKTIRLPPPARVVDLATGEAVAARTEEIRFEMTAPGTKIIWWLPEAGN